MFKLQNYPPSWPEISLGNQEHNAKMEHPWKQNHFAPHPLETGSAPCSGENSPQPRGSGISNIPKGFRCLHKAARHLSNANIPMKILHALGWKNPFGCFLTSSRQCLTLLRPDAAGLRIFVSKGQLCLWMKQMPLCSNLKCAVSDRNHKMQWN